MDTNSGIKVQVEFTPWYDGYEFLLRYDLGPHHLVGKLTEPMVTGVSGKTRIEFEEYEQGERLDSTFRLYPKDAQNLMDELWRCGLRPSEEVGSKGQLKATETHLEDMRQLVTRLMNREEQL